VSSALPPVDSLVFDLDGTLWDTCASCALAWNVVLRRHKISFREISASDVRKVTGKPHDVCIRETFDGLSEPQLRILVDETSTEDNRMIALHGGSLFAGVPEGITVLADSYPLFIVSNCQTGYIELFQRWSGLTEKFVDFECWGNTGRPKADNLYNVIARNRLTKPWFIGDASGDLAAARACRVPFVHATYGYGQVESAELRLHEFMDLPRALALV
jgi:phosphoglycolate phosphatase